MRIRTKLFVSFQSVVLGTVLVLMGVVYFVLVSDFEKNTGKHLENNVSHAGKAIDEFMLKMVMSLKTFSNNPIFSIGNNGNISVYLSELISTSPFYDMLSYTDEKGVILVSSNKSIVGKNILTLKPEIKDEFKKIISGGTQDVCLLDMSDASESELKMQFLNIEILSAVIDLNGAKLGTLIGVVNIQFIKDILFDVGKQTIGNENVYLLDDKGNVLLATDSNAKILKPHPDLKNEVLKQKLEKDKNGYVVYAGSNGRKVISVSTALSKYGTGSVFGWRLLSTALHEDIMKPVYQLLYTLMFMLFLVLIITFCVTFFLSRTMTDSVIKLKNALYRIGNGEFDSRVDIKSRDEIGALGAAFNKIASYVELTMETLEQKIIERKKAEKELLENKLLHMALFDDMLAFVMMLDSSGAIIFANNTVLNVLGFKLEKIKGKKFFDVSSWSYSDKMREMIKIDLEQCVSGKVVSHDARIKIADGSLMWIEFTMHSIHDEHGDVQYFIPEGHDITIRKQQEEEKLVFERRLQHTQKIESLGVLAGGIAHDFNNILMAIMGNADLALEELSSMSPISKNIRNIINASRRAAELATQMLAYSGKGVFVIKPIDLNELIDGILNLVEVSISKKIVFKTSFAKNLPTFDGDVTQIRQIVLNLITNASEAIADNSGVITLSTGVIFCDRSYLDNVNYALLAGLKKQLPEGIYVYIEVVDTGCGMDTEIVEKIFDPFFTTKFIGRGLGMSAVLGIVRGHKGALKIYSKVGKGTTFKVLFPINELSGNDLSAQSKKKTMGKDWCGSGTILLVDDEEVVCTVCKQMLECMNFSVLTASDGIEALKIFSEHADEFVCVILDLTMPHVDGEETFREMLRIRSSVSIILCSGYSEKDAIRGFAGKKGFAGFIQKPFTMDTLRKTLMEVLNKRTLRSSGKTN